MSTDSREHHECGLKISQFGILIDLVIVVPFYSTAPAEILSPQEPTDISVNETDSVSLTCTARGFPAVDFTWWYQNTTQLMDSPRLSIQSMTVEIINGFLDTTSILTIPSVDRADAGDYTCVASNTVFGSPMQDVQQFMLTVNCKCLVDMHVVPITVIPFIKYVFSPMREKLMGLFSELSAVACISLLHTCTQYWLLSLCSL